MKNKIVVYNADKYSIMRNEKHVSKAYFTLRIGDKIRAVDRCNGKEYCYYIDNKMLISSDDFINLSPHCIMLFPREILPRYMNEVLKKEHLNGSLLTITYDGITHFRLEDAHYIYAFSEPFKAKIDVVNDGDIYIIRYRNETRERLIILKKVEDYEELIDVYGDEIIIRDEDILVKMHFFDSMSRTRTRHYTPLNGKYMMTSEEFAYGIDTPHISAHLIVEDAIIAEDYDYICEKYTLDMTSDDIRGYFDSILDTKRDYLSIRGADENMVYIMCSRDNICRVIPIKLLFQNGKIYDFEESK